MRVILNPFGEADRAILSEEIDAEIAKLARAINGGLDVNNLAKTTKFSPAAEAGAVPYAFLEPNSLFVIQGQGPTSSSVLDLGSLNGSYYPGGGVGAPVYACVVCPSQFTSATFKVGGTMFAAVTPAKIANWDSRLGPDSATTPRLYAGHTRVFSAAVTADSPITVAFAPAANYTPVYAAVYFKHVHWSV